MSKYYDDLYRFTIENDRVMAVYEVEGKRLERERMEADEEWSYDPATRNVTEREYEGRRIETTVYADPDGDGLYVKQREARESLDRPSASTDQQYGSARDDELFATTGRDLLAGGRGADIFVYASLDELGLGRSRDTIRDFRASEGDLLDLSALDADPLQDGQQSFVLLDRAPVSGEAAGAVWFKKGVLNVSTDADAQAEYQIVLSGVRTLSLDDLLL